MFSANRYPFAPIGTATGHSFETVYQNGGQTDVRSHAYRWTATQHGVTLADRDLVAARLDGPHTGDLPGAPTAVPAVLGTVP